MGGGGSILYQQIQQWGLVLNMRNNNQIGGMLSSLKLNTHTIIGREEEKKLTQIISYLLDLPEATQFVNPVDWKELQLNDYPLIVKHPMNLLKVQDKLKGREYRTIQETLDHIQLIWDNCKAYNPEGHYYVLADKMERNFKKMIRNYLPNIQVIVPKPINSSGHPVNPEKPAPPPPIKTSSRPTPKAPVVSYANFPVNKEHYEEPPSVNEHPGDMGESEEIPLSQKNRLHQRLKQLTQQELAQIVFIIQENCSEGFKDMGGGRSQLMLDNIDGQTFKKINAKIDELLEGEKATGSKKIKV